MGDELKQPTPMATSEEKRTILEMLVKLSASLDRILGSSPTSPTSTTAPTTGSMVSPNHDIGDKHSTAASPLSGASEMACIAQISQAKEAQLGACRVFDEMPGHQEENTGRVLRVTVSQVFYPVTEEVLHQVFDAYGAEKVCDLKVADRTEALVLFRSSHDVVRARDAYHGRCIYDNCCWLDLQYVQPLPTNSTPVMSGKCSTPRLSHDAEKPKAASTKAEQPGACRVFDEMPRKTESGARYHRFVRWVSRVRITRRPVRWAMRSKHGNSGCEVDVSDVKEDKAAHGDVLDTELKHTVKLDIKQPTKVFDEMTLKAGVMEGKTDGLSLWEEEYYTSTRQWQTMILGSDHVVFVELPQDSRPRERLSQEHLKAWLQPAAATSSATMGAKPCTAPMSRWCMHSPGWLVWSCGAHAVAASDIKSTLKLGSDQDIRRINDNRTRTPDWEISGIQLTFDEMPPWQRNDFSPGIFGIEKARSVRVVMPSWRLSGFSPESQVTGYPSVLRFRVLNKAKMVVAMNIMVSNSGAATIANFPILQVVWLLLPWPPPGRSEFAHGLMSIIFLQLSRPWDSSAPSNGLKKHSARWLFNKIEYSAAKQWDPGIMRLILMGMKSELGINQSLVQYVQKSLELIQHTASYVIWKQLLAHWLWTCGLWSSASQDSTFMLSNMDQKGSSYRMMEWVSVEVLVADRSMGIALEFFLCFIGREYSVTHRSIPPNAPPACALPEVGMILLESQLNCWHRENFMMCIIIFVGTNGETYFNTDVLVSCVQNFLKSCGPIVGILKGFAGLSGAILTQIYAMIHSPDHAPLIFMVVVGPTKVVITLMFIIRPAGGHRQIHPSDGTGFTFVYSICLLLVVYLLGVMILENLVDWSHTVMVLFTIILIVLLLFPIAIPAILSFFSDDGESVYALLSPSPRTEEASAPFEEQNEVILSEVEDEKPKEIDLFPASEQQKRIVELQAKLFQAAAVGAVRVNRRKGLRQGEDFILIQAR